MVQIVSVSYDCLIICISSSHHIQVQMYTLIVHNKFRIDLFLICCIIFGRLLLQFYLLLLPPILLEIEFNFIEVSHSIYSVLQIFVLLFHQVVWSLELRDLVSELLSLFDPFLLLIQQEIHSLLPVLVAIRVNSGFYSLSYLRLREAILWCSFHKIHSIWIIYHCLTSRNIIGNDAWFPQLFNLAVAQSLCDYVDGIRPWSSQVVSIPRTRLVGLLQCFSILPVLDDLLSPFLLDISPCLLIWIYDNRLSLRPSAHHVDHDLWIGWMVIFLHLQAAILLCAVGFLLVGFHYDIHFQFVIFSMGFPLQEYLRILSHLLLLLLVEIKLLLLSSLLFPWLRQCHIHFLFQDFGHLRVMCCTAFISFSFWFCFIFRDLHQLWIAWRTLSCCFSVVYANIDFALCLFRIIEFGQILQIVVNLVMWQIRIFAFGAWPKWVLMLQIDQWVFCSFSSFSDLEALLLIAHFQRIEQVALFGDLSHDFSLNSYALLYVFQHRIRDDCRRHSADHDRWGWIQARQLLFFLLRCLQLLPQARYFLEELQFMPDLYLQPLLQLLYGLLETPQEFNLLLISSHSLPIFIFSSSWMLIILGIHSLTRLLHIILVFRSHIALHLTFPIIFQSPHLLFLLYGHFQCHGGAIFQRHRDLVAPSWVRIFIVLPTLLAGYVLDVIFVKLAKF